MTAREQEPVHDRDVDLADDALRGVADDMRGRKPSWITCWVTENAPEMTAWEAITVATVASTTIAFCPVCPPGTSRKNGFTIVAGCAEDQRALAHVVQEQGREGQAGATRG